MQKDILKLLDKKQITMNLLPWIMNIWIFQGIENFHLTLKILRIG